MSRLDDIDTLTKFLAATLNRGGFAPGPIRYREQLWHLLDDEVPWMLARIKALEAGLQFYADEYNYDRVGGEWPCWEDSDVQLEGGSLARAALAGES